MKNGQEEKDDFDGPADQMPNNDPAEKDDAPQEMP
jgi:hypothetical protein